LSAVAEGDCRPPERGDGIVADRGGRLPEEIWVLITANAVIALGYGVVSPVLPQYARNFGVSISSATFVITAFALMRLVFAPVSGLLVQRLGERRIYVCGILIVSLSTGACAFAQSYWQLLLFRSIGGIGSTMFFVSSLGLMIRVSPEHARGRVAGMFSTAFLVGSVGGPVLGSLTAGLGLETPFVIYGVALLIAAAVVFVSLRHSTLAAPERESEPPVSLRVALRQCAFRAALLSNFATGWSVFGLRMALVPLFVTEVLGRGPGMAGLALATFAAGNVSAVIPSGYVSDRVGRRTLLIVGLSVSGLATAIVGAASSLPLFLAGAFVAGAAAGMFSSPQQAAVADIVGSKARAGTALAAFQMMADLGSIVGSLVVGQIAQHLDFYWAFIVSGIILLVAALAWVLAPETRERAPSGRTPARALGPVAGGEVP
jgi:ACDE family multidrug resistance protein